MNIQFSSSTAYTPKFGYEEVGRISEKGKEIEKYYRENDTLPKDIINLGNNRLIKLNEDEVKQYEKYKADNPNGTKKIFASDVLGANVADTFGMPL